jgi:hypothetical protein
VFKSLRIASRIAALANVEWVVPSYEDEIGEFRRYTDLGEDDMKWVRAQFTPDRLRPLTDVIWRSLGNTDSYDVRDEAEAVNLAEKYEKDWKSIKTRLLSGGSIDAPIILVRGGQYELVAGNTRLMMSRVLGVQPKVLFVQS